MMFDKFELPQWFDASSETKSFLALLWNRYYSELYDDSFTCKKELTRGLLDKDILELLQCLHTTEEKLSCRLIYFNWALCLACKERIEGYRAKYDRSAFSYILKELKKWSKLKKFRTEFLNYQLDNKNFPGAIGESIGVFQNIIKMAKVDNKAKLTLLADSIDSCIEGAGIASGTEDNRAIFNWILIDVFPSAYCYKLPEFIYTESFRLPINWSYTRSISEA